MPNPKRPPSQGLWSDQEKTIRIPVRICTDGRIDYFYGGPLPQMREGTIGDLVVPEWSITENREVRRLQQDQVVRFLPLGSIVKFAVDGRRTPAQLTQHLKNVAALGLKKSHAVPVVLDKKALALRLRGTKTATLGRVTCWIPSLQIRAQSLNHAYRLISEQFEPERISHSGNVFELGYCESPPQSDRWVSLDTLRKTIAARFEMQLSRTAAQVLEQLPESVESALRECWPGSLQTPEALLKEFDRWQSQLKCDYNESALVDIQTALAQLRKILAPTSDARSEEDIRLIQAAVQYLVRERDEEHDPTSSIGVDDEVLVVRKIVEAIQPVGGGSSD